MTAVLSVSQRIIYIIISRSIYLNFCVYTPQVSVDSEGVLKRVPRMGVIVSSAWDTIAEPTLPRT